MIDNNDRILQLYQLMQKEGLEELEIREKDIHVRIKRKSKRTPKTVIMQHQDVPVIINGNIAPAVASIKSESIKSPLNGVFYRSPSPQSAPFVKEGDVVDPGKTLCIIEAMKVMNEIKAEKKTKISKLLVENGVPVNVDQEIFLIEPV